MIYIIYHSHSSWTNKNMTSKSNVYQINAGIPVIATTKTSDLPSNILLQPIESHFIVKKKTKQNKTKQNKKKHLQCFSPLMEYDWVQML